MTNEVVTWKEELAAAAKAVAKVERPSVAGISLKAGMMQLSRVPVPGNKLLCVVVASIFENKYFSGAYDPNKVVPPDCFAYSDDGENMAPHAEAKDPQSASCAGCPQTQWGSAVSNGRPSKGKACKEVRKLALLPASALIENGGVNGSEMAIISIPVTSVKNWSNYVNELNNEFARPPWAVLTEISVTPDAKTQFKVHFKYAGTVNDEYLGPMRERIASATQVLTQPYEYSEETPPPADTGKKKKY